MAGQKKGKSRTKKPAKGILALTAGNFSPKMTVAFLLAVGLLVTCGVLIIFTQNLVTELGYDIAKANQVVSNLELEQRELDRKKYQFLNLDRLHKMAKEYGLGKPSESQWIVIYDTRMATDER